MRGLYDLVANCTDGHDEHSHECDGGGPARDGRTTHLGGNGEGGGGGRRGVCSPFFPVIFSPRRVFCLGGGGISPCLFLEPASISHARCRRPPGSARQLFWRMRGRRPRRQAPPRRGC